MYAFSSENTDCGVFCCIPGQIAYCAQGHLVSRSAFISYMEKNDKQEELKEILKTEKFYLDKGYTAAREPSLV